MGVEDIKAKTKAGIIKNDYSQSMVEAVQRAKDKGLITDAQAKRLKNMYCHSIRYSLQNCATLNLYK